MHCADRQEDEFELVEGDGKGELTEVISYRVIAVSCVSIFSHQLVFSHLRIYAIGYSHR